MREKERKRMPQNSNCVGGYGVTNSSSTIASMDAFIMENKKKKRREKIKGGIMRVVELFCDCTKKLLKKMISGRADVKNRKD